jgi:hypothetical protein
MDMRIRGHRIRKLEKTKDTSEKAILLREVDRENTKNLTMNQ